MPVSTNDIAGLTQAMLDDFADLIDDFEEAKNLQHVKAIIRANASKERLNAGNAIYDLVATYCEIGKRVFVNTDPVRYNCYLIYTPGAVALTPPAGIHFTIANMSISWDNSENAVNYSVEISQDGLVFNEIYNSTANSYIYIPTFEGIFKIKARSHNAYGYSDYSDTYTFAYYSTLPPVNDLAISLVSGSVTMYQLYWSAIPSVTVYKVYKSEVIIGNPAGEYIYVADATGTVYSGNAVTGKRSWFILKCSNETQMSGWSNAVFLDVAAGSV